jgi:uncharacterized membrane protein YkoI
MSRLLVLAWLALAGGTGAATAAEPMRCLGADERRAAIAANKAVPLARAIRVARGRAGGDLVRARLCESGQRLVYLLTLLSRDGKVTRVTVDAASGRLIGRR